MFLVYFVDVVGEALVDAVDFGLDVAFFTMEKVAVAKGVWREGVGFDVLVLVGDMGKDCSGAFLDGFGESGITGRKGARVWTTGYGWRVFGESRGLCLGCVKLEDDQDKTRSCGDDKSRLEETASNCGW